MDELPRDNRGIRVDVRGSRDLIFNKWHRENLERHCYVTDVDFLEYRFENDEIVLKAIFEVKESHVTDRRYIEDNANFKATHKLSQLSNLPFFVIWYYVKEGKITGFKVWNVSESRETAIYMLPDAFKKFVEDY